MFRPCFCHFWANEVAPKSFIDAGGPKKAHSSLIWSLFKELLHSNLPLRRSWIINDLHSFCAIKMYLLLTPSKTDGRVPSQQGAPTTCNLTYRRMSKHYRPVWVKAIGQYFSTKLFIVFFNLWVCGHSVTINMKESTKSLQIYRVIAYFQIQPLYYWSSCCSVS